MHDYAEFKVQCEAKIEAFHNYLFSDFENLFGGQIKVEGRTIGSGSLTIEGKEDPSVKIEGGESSGISNEDKSKGKVEQRSKIFFNSIFFFLSTPIEHLGSKVK